VDSDQSVLRQAVADIGDGFFIKPGHPGKVGTAAFSVVPEIVQNSCSIEFFQYSGIA